MNFRSPECNLTESEIRELWDCAFVPPIPSYHEEDQRQVAKTRENVPLEKKGENDNIQDN